MAVPTGKRQIVPFALAGGMNTADSQFILKPGVARLLYGHEVVPGDGYRRSEGWERWDGSTGAKGHLASERQVVVVSGVCGLPPGPIVGETVTGGTSGATGTVVSYSTVSTGPTTMTIVAFVSTSGTFTDGESASSPSINVSGSIVGTYNSTTIPRGNGYKDGLREIHKLTRALCNPVPGEGRVLGVCIYQGKVLAFRNVVGGATATMWEAASSGVWVSKKTGLTPNGRYEFVVHNFGGAAGAEKLYGVSGVHKGFQWDGTTWTDITTGMVTDTPTHLAVHMSRLFFSFPKGSVQWSSVNDPLTWSVITGAGEIGLGDEVTALRSLKTDQLIVAGADRVMGLYGSSFDAASFVPLLSGTGCFGWCMADIGGVPLAADSIGVFTIQQGQISGDYTPKPVSREVERELKDSIAANRAASASMFAVFCRRKSQYRLFSPADGYEYRLALLGTKPYGWSRHPSASAGTGSGSYTASGQIVCAFVGEDSSGAEFMVGGTDAGFVVKLDSGASVDGDMIAARCDLVDTTLGAAQNGKRIHGVSLELDYTPDANGAIGIVPSFTVAADMGLGESQNVNAGGATVDEFVQRTVGALTSATKAAEVYFPASVTGRTVSAQLTVTDDIDPPYTIRSAAYDAQVLGMRK